MNGAACWNCGQKVNPGDAKCPRCGSSLVQASQASVRCPNGHIVEDGKAFCPWCGESVGRPTSPASPPASPSPPVSPGPASLSDGGKKAPAPTPRVPPPVPAGSSESRRTVIIPQDGGGKTVIAGQPIAASREGSESPEGSAVVGFLVSYTLNPNGAIFQLRQGRQSIGKGLDARIRVQDQLLSDEHAILLYRNEKFIFEDRLSSNGTTINGLEAIGQLIVKHGDCLKMGSHAYILVTIPRDMA